MASDRHLSGRYRRFAAVSPFADRDAIVRFLLDEQSAERRQFNIVRIGVDDDRVPEPDADFYDVEYTAALTIISGLREWRLAHDSNRSQHPS